MRFMLIIKYKVVSQLNEIHKTTYLFEDTSLFPNFARAGIFLYLPIEQL